MAKTKLGTIKDTDKGFKALEEKMMELTRGKYVALGLIGEAAVKEHDGEGEKLTIVNIGAIHEFGNDEGRPPQRSWLRGWIDGSLPEYQTVITDLTRQLVDNKTTVKKAMTELGMWARAGVQARIRKGIEPALSEVTKEAKARRSVGTKDTPLINTSQFINSINYDIRQDDPKKR
jgi:hypothetical protein